MRWITIVLVGLCMAGCFESQDLETGEKTYQLDPVASVKVETGVEAGIDVLTALRVAWPSFIPAGLLTALAGALGVYRKIKPQLTEAQTKAMVYYATTDSIVNAIEEFKETNPDDWGKLETKLVKALGPEAVNIIRALRGLPPKT